jgi:hypothetical protein
VNLLTTTLITTLVGLHSLFANPQVVLTARAFHTEIAAVANFLFFRSQLVASSFYGTTGPFLTPAETKGLAKEVLKSIFRTHSGQLFLQYQNE